MKIAVTGANGFIGKELTKHLENKGFTCLKIPHQIIYEKSHLLSDTLSKADIVINLAGSSIQKRWTRKNKLDIYRSRVHTTRILIKTVSELLQRPKKIISVSAIGIYDTKNIHDEYSRNLSYDYLGRVARDWEEATLFAKNYGIEVYILRLGIVLGSSGGLIKKLLPLFKAGLGATIANGKQKMSFIHIEDLLSIFTFAIENKIPEGIYNAVAPHYTTNKEFSKTFARQLNRPLLFSVPKQLLHLIYGQGASVLYSSQAVIPQALIDNQFVFKYENIEKALCDIVNKSRF
ncbi:MAG: TIGR01777 family oxidoreductase [Bacteroidales bacterium]|nr:TIGR01777 family oxidoreductase [Bacteroidales bacterium]